ncbi:MAG: DUF560 domain-containing protein [Alphaproteobacteria bacterium]|nr:DUF560 domain-containing protein [Alphaproteobacteria bacterium]
MTTQTSPTHFEALLPALGATGAQYAPPAWASAISSVHIDPVDSAARLVIETRAPARFKSFVLTPDSDGGHRLVVDVFPAEEPAPPKAEAAAAGTDDALDAARMEISQALAAGDPRRACALAEERFPDGTWDLEAMFLEAQCRTELGEIEEARALYQRMLAFDPGLERVELELEALPEPGASAPVPDAMDKTTEAPSAPSPALGALARPSSLAVRGGADAALWSVEGRVTAIYESAIELGPSDPETAAFDAGPLLDVAGEPTSSAGVEVALDTDMHLALGPSLAAIARLGVAGTEYFDGDFDSMTFGLAAGLAYAPGDYTLRLMPHVYHQRLDGDGYRTRYGASADAGTSLTPWLDADLAIVTGYEDYSDFDGRDAKLLAVLPGLEAHPNERLAVAAQYFAEARDSDDDRIAAFRHGPVLSAYGRPVRFLEAQARASYYFTGEQASVGPDNLGELDLGVFWLPRPEELDALRVGLGYRWREQASASNLGASQHRALLSLGTTF